MNIEEKYILLSNPTAIKYNEKSYRVNCHICGDSKKVKNKRRLWFYKKKPEDNLKVHCFNCDYHNSFKGYLRDFHPSLYSSYISELKKLNFLSLSKSESLDNFKIEKSKPKNEESKNLLNISNLPKEFVPLHESKEALKYLESRKIIYKKSFNWFFCSEIVTLNNVKVNLKNFIIIPLIKNNKIYGIHSRSIENKIFYNKLFDENETKCYNYYNIDKTKNIYVFESVFDLLSSGKENSIALLGSSLNLDLPEDKLIYCLDNFTKDEAAYKSISKILKEKNIKIFNWNGLEAKDFNSLLCDYNLSIEEISKMIEERILSGLFAKLALKLKF